jgi:hypothetical protein
MPANKNTGIKSPSARILRIKTEISLKCGVDRPEEIENFAREPYVFHAILHARAGSSLKEQDQKRQNFTFL